MDDNNNNTKEKEEDPNYEEILDFFLNSLEKTIGINSNSSIEDFAKKINEFDFEDQWSPLFETMFNMGSIMFDPYFQDEFNNQNLVFYQEVENLIQKAKNHKREYAEDLLSHFFEIKAIKIFRKPALRNYTSGLMTLAELKAPRGFLKNIETEDITVKMVLKELLDKFQSANRKTQEILFFPGIKKKEIENLTNNIKNYYEMSRYVFGAILGLFDIIDDDFNKDLSYYFSPRKSPAQLYYPPKVRYEQRLKIQDYWIKPEYLKEFASIRYFFEDWILKKFIEIRIHKAHKEMDLKQDRLNDDVYKIVRDSPIRDYREYTFEEIDNIERDFFTFINWFILIVAKQFFTDYKAYLDYMFSNKI